MIQLRYYQVDKMVRPALDARKMGHREICIVAPTGAGKTAVACWWAQMAEKAGKTVLILVHKKTILNQFVRDAHALGLNVEVIASGRPITYGTVYIAMVSTLIHRLDMFCGIGWIIGDECHHWRTNNMWGKTFKHYKDENPELLTLGLTATPQGRTDSLGLHPFFSYMVNDLTQRYLTDEGWLVYPHMMKGVRVDPKFHITNGDYDTKEQEEHFEKKQIVGNVIDNYAQFLDGLPTIVSCVSLQHAYQMAEAYNTAAREKGKNWKAVMIQGGQKYERQMIDAIAGLASGSVQIVTFVDVLGEGVDVPACIGLQMCRKMKSYVLYKQFGGRIVRPIWPEGFNQYESTRESRLEAIRKSIKPQAEAQDFVGNVDEHHHLIWEPGWSLLDEKEIKERTSIIPPEITVCPSCGGVYEGHVYICPDCGFNIEEKKLHDAGKKTPKEIEGILTEVSDTEAEITALKLEAETMQQMSPEERQRRMIYNLRRFGPSSDKVAALAKITGYKNGWAEHVYKRILK